MVRSISSLYPRDGNRANLCMTTALMKSLGLSVFPDHVVAMMVLTQWLVLTFPEVECTSTYMTSLDCIGDPQSTTD